MKNSIYTLCFSAISFVNVAAQVGISTANPQQPLHIAGGSSSTAVTINSALVKPTIRIEGLNNTNQGITAVLKPVSATQDGDLVVETNYFPNAILVTSPGTDAFPVASIVPHSGTTGSVPIKSFSFTLTRQSLVRFIASTSVKLTTATGTTITDAGAKSYGTKFQFSSATDASFVGKDFGTDVEPYSNAVNSTASQGYMYVVSQDLISLPAGSYTVELIGLIEKGSAAANMNVYFGQDAQDNFSIVGFPIQ